MHPPSSKSTISDLEKFTQDRAAGSLLSLDEFAKYWNDFDAIARVLLERKLINKAERDLYFWTGLPFAARRSISQQLATTDLAFHDRLIPTWRDAIQAGRIVFHDPSVHLVLSSVCSPLTFPGRWIPPSQQKTLTSSFERYTPSGWMTQTMQSHMLAYSLLPQQWLTGSNLLDDGLGLPLTLDCRLQLHRLRLIVRLSDAFNPMSRISGARIV
jgi:hypothetical protein